MNKSLTTKIQKLIPRFPGVTSVFSSASLVEPEESALKGKKGVLYTAFDISSDKDLDTLLVSKIVRDVLHDYYYGFENASPIQALEKAILQLNDKIMNLEKSSNVVFNITTAVLWGNVLYIVEYGDGKSFLVRDNEIKSINSSNEGKFNVASGVVKDGDIVILATNDFSNSYTPEDLTNRTTPISEYDLTPKSACLIIKFEISATFSEDELIKFELPQKSSANFAKLRSILNFKAANKNSNEAISSIGIKLKSEKNYKVPAIIFISVLIVLFGAAIFYTVQKKNSGNSQLPKTQGATTVNTFNNAEPLDTNDSKDVLYDLRLISETASATEIFGDENNIYLVDSSSGSIFVSSKETSKFVKDINSFTGAKNLNFEEYLTFTTSTKLVLYDTYSSEVIVEFETTDVQTFGPSAYYLDFVYSVVGDKIIKFSKDTSTNVLESSTWAQQPIISGTYSIAIDGNIYLLKKDGSINKFYMGDQVDFKISGLEVSLNNPSKVYTNFDLDFLYILDNGNNRIVVLDKDGNFEKEIKLSISSLSSNADFWIDATLEKVFLLNGTKIYSFDLN